MSRQDEMRELVKRLAGHSANRHQLLDSLRSDVQLQRDDAAVAIREMAAARAEMSAELHDSLAGDLSGLRDAVRTMRDEFDAGHQDMKAGLQADLAATRQERQHQVTTLRSDARQFMEEVAETRLATAADLSAWLADNHVELHASVRELLGNLASARATASANMRRALAAECEARRQDVANMVADIEAMLDRFAAENRATASELHQFLDANSAQRQQALAGLLATIRALLQQLAAENHTAANELQAFLAADCATRSAAVAGFMADIVAQRHAMTQDLAARLESFVANLNGDVLAAVAGFRNERHELHASLAEMSAIWRAYAAHLQEPGAETEMSMVTAATAPGSAADDEPTPTITIKPETAPALTEAELTKRILGFLTNKPDGVKLVELEPELGLSRPQIGKHLRSLVDCGQIVKDHETLVYKLA